VSDLCAGMAEISPLIASGSLSALPNYDRPAIEPPLRAMLFAPLNRSSGRPLKDSR